ncbi:MAG: hypothetical protein A2X97_08660 [Bdellovibrionales bacterium GWA1_52_35]|nr:MAG: hypothetical protein A2X97_08660 [Bdellovibrionales bacterium GWA1_52_35]HCM41197.1 hypothetical protein [Bdellovibrionales bacterium]
MVDLITYKEEAAKHALQFKELHVEFFSSRPPKFAQLASRSPRQDSNAFRVNDEGFLFELKFPAFIRRVEFVAEASSTKPPSLKVELLPITDNPASAVKTEPDSEKPNVLVAEINAIVRGFKVAPDGFFSKLRTHKLTHVLVYGYSLTDLENLEDAIYWYIDAKARFNSTIESGFQSLELAKAALSKQESDWKASVEGTKKELAEKATEQAKQLKAESEEVAKTLIANKKIHDDQIAKIQTEIKAKEIEIRAFTEQLQKLSEERVRLVSGNAELTTQKERLSKFVDEQQKQDRDLEQRIAEKSAALSHMTKEAAVLSERLREMNNDVSMFADDMKGVVQQGDQQISKYLKIIWACLLIGAGLAIFSVCSTINVFDTFVAKPELTVKGLLFVKAPFVFIMASVFTFLFSFAKPFLVRIREIHAKRLRIAEISMLAREISDSALHGECVSDEERAQVRLEVRMKFLRDYLTGALDPVHSPVTIQDQERKRTDVRAIVGDILTKSLSTKINTGNTAKVVPEVSASKNVN